MHMYHNYVNKIVPVYKGFAKYRTKISNNFKKTKKLYTRQIAKYTTCFAIYMTKIDRKSYFIL